MSPTEALPGAPPLPAELRQRLEEALAAKGPDYEPRTEYLLADGRPRFLNRLILEDSPYLIQHAHNPVNWFAWGPEAFAAARELDRPIFLSVGYSTCHWCHVMERESFDNVELARLLNEHFIPVKVDREQRPDVDEIYMTAVQLTTGHGGWPMSTFLTPEGKPFYGGTYFPPTNFAALLQALAEAWRERRPQVLDTAEHIAASVAEATAARGRAAEVGEAAVEKAVEQILARHDARLGGFSGAPKFPHEPDLLLLLDAVIRHRREDALAAAEKSLTAMAEGGIYDQVGGGFHRYSTDARWLVPHFEKMLYNQAQLARAYARAFQLTVEPLYGRVARQTLDYVLRDMTSPQGAFYSATDADSEGEEGRFFVWTPEELRAILPEADAELAIDLYGVTEEGNFEGRNILHLPVSLETWAEDHDMDATTVVARLESVRETLRRAREKREHPLRDEKVLTAWNAMMITAFAEAGEALDEARYLEAAERAAAFLWRHNRRRPGELWRAHLAGSSSIPATQEDYACLAEALLTLYDATAEPLWLERAREVADAMLEKFWDGDGGGFFLSAEGADPHLIARPKSPTDGATPSGNSVAVRALAMLAARAGEARYRERAEATLAAFSSIIERYPSGFSYMMLGAAELLAGAAGPRGYGAGGAVAARARQEAGRIRVEVRLREGWHINAHRTLREELIPTSLALDESGASGWGLGEVAYPPGERLALGFQDEPLALYRGTLEISAPLEPTGGEARGRAPVVPLRLRFQACDDQRCLRPEELALEVPAAGF